VDRTGSGPICPSCGTHPVDDDDFICGVCFARLPAQYKRKLRFARGRADEPKKKAESLEWLRKMNDSQQKRT